jgi:hypothetical protein
MIKAMLEDDCGNVAKDDLKRETRHMHLGWEPTLITKTRSERI